MPVDQLLFPLALTLIGAYFLWRNVRLIRDDDSLRKYVQYSPVGRFWIRRSGLDKTLEFTKMYFIPLGILVACTLCGLGLRSLYSLGRVWLG